MRIRVAAGIALVVLGVVALSAARQLHTVDDRGQVHATSPSPLAAVRPAAATDDALRAAVRTTIESCAVATAARSVDCPPEMQPANGTVPNLSWTLAVDPTAGPTVTFDASTGLFDVLGRYRISAVSDLGLVGITHQLEPVARGYDAVVEWDAGTAKVLEIRDVG